MFHLGKSLWPTALRWEAGPAWVGVVRQRQVPAAVQSLPEMTPTCPSCELAQLTPKSRMSSEVLLRAPGLSAGDGRPEEYPVSQRKDCAVWDQALVKHPSSWDCPVLKA